MKAGYGSRPGWNRSMEPVGWCMYNIHVQSVPFVQISNCNFIGALMNLQSRCVEKGVCVFPGFSVLCHYLITASPTVERPL